MRDEQGDTLQHEWNIAKIPLLEPDPEPREPFQNLPGVVPPHAPINPAPFLRHCTPPPGETLPRSGREFVPGHTPIDMPRHSRYEDFPAGAAMPRDRWGITMLERLSARGYGPEADAARASRSTYPMAGMRAALAGGALVTIVYGAVALVFGFEFIAALVAIGAVIGWRLPVAWGRAGVATGTIAAVMTAVFAWFALTAGVVSESLRAGVGGLGAFPAAVADAASAGVGARMLAEPQVALWCVVAVAVAAVLGAGVGRVWRR